MNMHNVPIAVFIYVAVLCGSTAFGLWTSRINQFFFFGRTVAPGLLLTPEAKQITRRYSQRILFKSGVAIAGFAALRLIAGIPLMASFVLACIAQIVGFHVSFARAHREAGKAFEGRQDATAAEFSGSEAAQRVIAIPLLNAGATARFRLLTILLPILLAGAGWLLVMASSGLNMASLSGAVDRNGGSALEGFGLGVLCAGTIFSLLMRYSSRYRTPMAQCALRTLFLLEWVGMLALLVSALTVPLHFVMTHWTTRAMIFSALAFVVIYAISSKRRLSRCAPPPVERIGDQFWRWGLFYKNAQDPSLFIQARCGQGYTLNFGKAMAWPIAAAVFGDLVLLVALGFHHF